MSRKTKSANKSKNKTEPRISVIIFSYNFEKYLDSSIRSILDQTLKPYEIIISDDCSDDSSWNIIQRYAKKYPTLIRAFRQEKNVGNVQNGLFARARVRGDLQSEIDGDDRWLPQKLELEWKALQKNRQAKVAYSNVILTNEQGSPERFYVQPGDPPPPQGDVFVQTFSKRFFKDMRSIFRNELIYRDTYLEFQRDPAVGVYSDWDLKIRVSSKYPVVYSGQPLVEYRVHEHGIHRTYGSSIYDSAQKVVQKNIHLLDERTEEEKRYVLENLETLLHQEYLYSQQAKEREMKKMATRDKKTAGKGENLIFLISQPRAGSTLLQRVLGGHSQVHTLAEPWIMLHPLYALKDQGIEGEFSSHEARIGLEDFVAELPNGQQDYIEALRLMGTHLYDKALEKSGKKYFLDKTPRYYFIIDELIRVFPKAKFVFLIRNPLAVLSSILETWIKTDWPRLGLHRHDLIKAPFLLYEGIRQLGDQAVVVRYEDYVNYPREQTKELCEILGMPFEEEMLDYGQKEKPKGRMGDPDGVHKYSKPVGDNVSKWLENLHQPQRLLLAEIYLELLGADLLKAFGYDRDELRAQLTSLYNDQMRMHSEQVAQAVGPLELDDYTVNLLMPLFQKYIHFENKKEVSVYTDKESNYLVSAIVSTYNSEKFIEGCLQDLISQTLYQKNMLQIIVVNSGSQENEEAVIQKYLGNKHIKYIKTENRETIYQAWNRGVKAASAKYLTNANTDDRHRNDSFEVLANVLEANPNVALAYGDQIITETENETFEKHTAVDKFCWPDYSLPELLQRCITGSQPMWRKSLHEEFGYFDESYQIAGDYEFWLRIAQKYPFQHVAQFMGLYYRSQFNAEYRNHQLTIKETQHIQNHYRVKLLQSAENAKKEPLVSVIIPTYNRPDGLRSALQSVAEQTYKNIEAVVVNDAGEDVSPVINKFKDKLNIKYIVHEQNKDRAAARNTGLQNAAGEYIAYLDDDDAFFANHIREAVNVLTRSDYKIVYSDALRLHQKEQNGKIVTTNMDIPYSVNFNADRLLLSNYIPMLCVVHEKSCLKNTGVFDENLGTHEDWDLFIRFSRQYPFYHNKKITCQFSWRFDGSTTSSESRQNFLKTIKMIYTRYIDLAQNNKAILDYQRQHLKNLAREIGDQKDTADKTNALITPKQEFIGPGVSIVIPLYNQLQYTQMCLSAVLKNTLYAPYEIILVNDASEDGTYEYLEELKQKNTAIKVIHNEQNLSFAGSCNRGARAAEGKYIVFLNNDTEVQKEWLVNLVAMAHNDPQIGAVGSKLLYPDGTIQHAGVLVTRDEKAGNLLAPWHLHNGKPGNFEPANKPHYFQAVTAACILISKQAFEQAGGFDEGYRNGYEDVDLCFTLAEQGRRIVYQPESVVIHHESKSGPRRFAFMNDNTKRLHGKWLGKIVPDTVLKKDGTAKIVKDSKTVPYLNWHSKFVPDENGQMTHSRAQHNDRHVVHDNDQVATLSISKGRQSDADSNIRAETHNTDSELRIGYLSLGPDNLACPQLRLKSPLTALQKQGAIKISPFNLQDGKKVSLNLNDLVSLDILIIQRHFTSVFSYKQLIEALGERRPKIIFEFDDALDRLPQSNPGYAYHQQLKPRFEEYIRQADLVTVSTEQLKEYYSAWNAHIVVLPNLLDEDIWQKSFKKTSKKSGKIRMLFAGTSTHAADFALIEAAVKKILDEYNEVELLLWGEEGVSLKGYSNVKVLKEFEFTYANYAKSLQKLNVDFALVPLADDAFNRGKSNIKWLEYSASKIPAIYSDIRPYSDFVKHNKTGILAKNETERWYKAIKNLISNPKKCKTISRAAHKEVWENFILQAHLSKWQKVYIRLVDTNILLSDDSNTDSFSERSEESAPHTNKHLGNGHPIRNASSAKILSQKNRVQKDNVRLVSIIIPVFNKLDFTKGCIEAIYKNTQIKDFEIILVDNASTDGTLEYLIEIQSKKDNFVVISNKENAGFAGANNQAAKIATGKYLVFLNNDTAVQPGWLKAMLNVIENDNEVGVVGSKLLYEDGKIQHAGVWILDYKPGADPLLAMNAYVNQPQDFAPANMAMTYQAVTGACMLVGNDLYHRLGGFDEGFWNGYEDVDLCFRIAAQGKKIVYEPRSVVTHFESKSGAERFSKVKENIERLHQKWLNTIKADYIVDSDSNFQPTDSQRIAPYVRTRAQESQKTLVSIIMLTYNAMDYTKKCIKSIYTHTSVPFELVLVDNNSKDGTRKYLQSLKKKHKNVQVILNRSNKGFAAGNNQGVAKAKGNYVLILNNDVLVADGWLESMLDGLKKHPSIGAVGPITNHISGLQRVENVPYKDISGFPEFAAQVRRANRNKLTPRRRLAGFAVLMPKSIYHQINGFDESFGNGNFEDDDLCLRLRQAGYALFVDESTYIHHFGSQTFKANKMDYSASLEEKGALFRERWPEVDYQELLEIKNPLSIKHAQLMSRAADLQASGELEQSIQLYQQILQENPIHITARFALVVTLNALGRYVQSLEQCRQLLTLEPESADVFNQCGIAFSRLKDFQAALDAFSKAVQLNPQLVDAQRNYGDMLIENGAYPEGVAAFMKILQNHPQDVPSLLYLAQLYLETEHPEKSLELINKVLEIEPQNELAAQLMHIIQDSNKPGELKYVVAVLPWHERSGGTIVMHKLCHLLNENGCDASLFPLVQQEKDFSLNPKFNTPVRDRNRPLSANEVVIYPEIVSGNPLRAHKVVRWLLNKPGVIGGDGVFAENDLLFYQNPDFVPKGVKAEKLHLVHTDIDIFANRGQHRQGSCYFVGKCKSPNFIHESNALKISQTMSNVELADIFNHCNLFYCYDNFTFLAKLAVLCGCQTVVIPDGSTTREKFLISNPVGIAYGPEDLQRARETMADMQKLLQDWEAEALEDVKSFINRVNVWFQTSDDKKKPVSESELQLAEQSVAQKEYSKALGILNPLLATNPADARVLNLAGLAFEGMKETADAERCFALAIENDPSFIDAQRNYGHLLIEKGEYENGVRVFNSILKNHPEDIPALLYMAQLYLEAGRHTEAHAFLDKALAIKPDFPLALELKDLIEADAASQKDQAPNEIDEKISAANRALEEGEGETAAKMYREVLQEDANNISALFGLVVYYQSAGELDESKKILDQIIDLAPEFVEAYSVYGNILYAQQKWPEAIAKYDRALELNPGQPDTMVSLASAHIENGAYEQGVQLLTGTIQKFPDNAGAYRHLGVCYLEAGRDDQAKPILRRAAELDPQDEEVQKLLEVLG